MRPLDDAVYNFNELYRDKHALTRMAEKHLQTHDFTYLNGKKAPVGDEIPLHLGKPAERDRVR